MNYPFLRNAKPCLLAGLFVLLLGSCRQPDKDAAEATTAEAAPEPPVYRNYTIRPGSVGGYALGSTEAQVIAQAGAGHVKRESYEAEGHRFRAIEIYDSDTTRTPDLVLQLNCREQECRVRQIIVNDRSFHTPEGIGIGSTYKQLKAHYPLQYLGWGEGALVAVARDAPISFAFDPADVPQKVLAKINAATLPDETKVSGIFIFQPDSAASEQGAEKQK